MGLVEEVLHGALLQRQGLNKAVSRMFEVVDDHPREDFVSLALPLQLGVFEQQRSHFGALLGNTLRGRLPAAPHKSTFFVG